MKTRNFSKLVGAATAAVMLSLGQSANALEISPYFHAWNGGVLTESQHEAGLGSATLAFGVTRGSCSFDEEFLNKLPDARAYIAAGGQLTISFGGQNGEYASSACKDDNQLFNLVEKVILDSGTRRVDLDVEGYKLLDVQSSARRARVLVRLQAKYPDFYTRLTLPGWLRGLDVNSMNMLKAAIDAGVRIDMVNVMTMSFGLENLRTMVVPSTVAQASIMTFRAAVSQMATLYPNKTQEQLHAMMGMTPMIGKNDDGSTFSLVDAKTIADFVKANGIGLLSYWSFQRDRAQASNASNDLTKYSGVAQSDYQFFNIFKTAGGSVVPPPPPDPTCSSSPWVQKQPYPVGRVVRHSNGTPYIAKFANPGYDPTISTYYWSQFSCAVTPPPPSTCSSTTWTQGRQYAPGSVVTYSNGKQYIAKFANPGYHPTVSTYFWSQYICAVTPPPAPVCSSSTWTRGRQYAAGSVVTYSNGQLYQATFANPGYNPTVSTYFWSRYIC